MVVSVIAKQQGIFKIKNILHIIVSIFYPTIILAETRLFTPHQLKVMPLMLQLRFLEMLSSGLD